MSILVSLLNVLVVISSLFLICLVLIQRGKGGGLAGAFGGAGGSSAFGTKAGDVFTKITMITALIWIVMLMMLVILSNRGSSSFPDSTPINSRSKSDLPGSTGKGTTGSSSELVPPLPLPAGGSSLPDDPAPSKAAPVVPPVSSTGPSAPVPVSPAPVTKPKS